MIPLLPNFMLVDIWKPRCRTNLLYCGATEATTREIPKVGSYLAREMKWRPDRAALMAGIKSVFI